MRFRSLIAVALLVPCISEAQLRAPVPRIGRRPGEVVPLGPQPVELARALNYTRSRYSVEAYPLISRAIAPAFTSGNPSSAWTSVGSGTRLDWQFTRYVSWTMDLTSTFLGGPTNTQTAELGLRFHEQDWDRRLRPFADVRVGYENASESYTQSRDLGIGPASGLAGGSRYSRGFGAVAGVGADYSLTNTFALTTGLSAMRSNMVTYRTNGVSVPTADDNFTMTTYRLTVGLRYNPIHMIRSANSQSLPNDRTH
ncbi:MAG: hypothetical protein JWL61_5575 [Gemmatimonadetes bacterium]|jgi:hypothetical protein|nr:hypothetical protein [Gemmatimonadota bacterium]